MARDDDDFAKLDDLVSSGLVFGDTKEEGLGENAGSSWDELDTPEMPEKKRRSFSRAKRSVDPDEDSASFLKKKKKRKEVSLDMVEDEDFDAIDADEDELAEISDDLDEFDEPPEEEDDDYGVMEDLLNIDDYVEEENTETDEEFMARQKALRGGKAVSKRAPRAIRRTETTPVARQEPPREIVPIEKPVRAVTVKTPPKPPLIKPERRTPARIFPEEVRIIEAPKVEKSTIIEPENNETEEEYEPEPHEKEDINVMQDKLVAGFLYGAGQLEKPKVKVGRDDVNAVLSGMRDGRYGRKAQRDLIRSIKSPIERFGEDGVDRRLGVAAEKERRILAYHTGRGFSNWRETDGVAIKEFLKKYPLPQDFDAASEGFLGVIRKSSGDVTYADYVSAMENFKWQIYGSRQDYFEALKLLIRKSEEQITTATGLIELDQVASREIIGATRIEGDAWIEGALERRLTVPILLRNKLTPKWKLELEDATFAFSTAYKMPTRDVILAYVLKDSIWKLRSYYRTALDGVWRYLPDYAMRQTGSGKTELWCGQAYAEEMLVLPAALQMRLSEITEKGFAHTLVDSGEFIFAGTALRYGSLKDYLDTRKLARLPGAIYGEVAARPTVVFGTPSRVKQRPSEVGVADASAQPDFSSVVHEWITPTGLNGKVRANSFYSKDGKLEYVFYEDSHHRAWLGQVEVKSPLTSTGLRAEWAYPGDLATPVFERTVKSDGYGDDAEQKGGYISMWSRYVSKLQVIKDYLRAKLDRR